MDSDQHEHGPAPMAGLRALVVDDEPQIRRFLRSALTAQGCDVSEAGSVKTALAQAAAVRPDLVILDLGLPDGDGLAVVRNLRTWTDIPILILSVRGLEADKIAALDAGADDYLSKPFSTGELMARLRAALRRAARPKGEPVIRTGGLVVDLASRLVTRDGVEVHLTSTEFALLKALTLEAGKVLTHRHLLEQAWGPAYAADTHILRVNISNLRRKLEPNPLRPAYIITEPGVGYRLRSVDPPPAPFPER